MSKGIEKEVHSSEAELLRHYVNPHDHRFSFSTITAAMAGAASNAHR